MATSRDVTTVPLAPVLIGTQSITSLSTAGCCPVPTPVPRLSSRASLPPVTRVTSREWSPLTCPDRLLWGDRHFGDTVYIRDTLLFLKGFKGILTSSSYLHGSYTLVGKSHECDIKSPVRGKTVIGATELRHVICFQRMSHTGTVSVGSEVTPGGGGNGGWASQTRRNSVSSWRGQSPGVFGMQRVHRQRSDRRGPRLRGPCAGAGARWSVGFPVPQGGDAADGVGV